MKASSVKLKATVPTLQTEVIEKQKYILMEEGNGKGYWDNRKDNKLNITNARSESNGKGENRWLKQLFKKMEKCLKNVSKTGKQFFFL